MRFKPPKILRKMMPALVWRLPLVAEVPRSRFEESLAHPQGRDGRASAFVRGQGAQNGGDNTSQPTSEFCGAATQHTAAPQRWADDSPPRRCAENNGGNKVVYLTFDDGPTPGITEWILKELARFGMKATFFCLGKNVEMWPELYDRIVAEGHRVGNHTYGHARGIGSTIRSYMRDVERANAFIHSDLFRPPYGRISPAKARLLSGRYKIVMWNIISRDYNRGLTRRACLNNVIRHVRAGDIVVFHDSEKAFKNLLFALPRTLKWLQDNGLTSRAIEL